MTDRLQQTQLRDLGQQLAVPQRPQHWLQDLVLLVPLVAACRFLLLGPLPVLECQAQVSARQEDLEHPQVTLDPQEDFQDVEAPLADRVSFRLSVC